MGRRGYPAEVREQAARLRGDGLGRADIARRLGLGVSTVCRWFREDGVPLPVEYRGGMVARQRAVAERWAAEQRQQDAHRDAVGPLTARELFLLGVGLYWAEGTKSKPWRPSHMLMFCNSDVTVINVFLAWLDLLGVDRKRLRCRVLIHESADVDAAARFWHEITGPRAVFMATGVKRHRPKDGQKEHRRALPRLSRGPSRGRGGSLPSSGGHVGRHHVRGNLRQTARADPPWCSG